MFIGKTFSYKTFQCRCYLFFFFFFYWYNLSSNFVQFSYLVNYYCAYFILKNGMRISSW